MGWEGVAEDCGATCADEVACGISWSNFPNPDVGEGLSGRGETMPGFGKNLSRKPFTHADIPLTRGATDTAVNKGKKRRL
ncbi:MAG TPA: hypothetical protein DHW49_05475 [Anaerolineae bacterium]|nr:hypothetical protein [Anaerolineae bacterium]